MRERTCLVFYVDLMLQIFHRFSNTQLIKAFSRFSVCAYYGTQNSLSLLVVCIDYLILELFYWLSTYIRYNLI